mgnify:CR=1 FL=1
MKRFANGIARLVFGLCVVMASPAWAEGPLNYLDLSKHIEEPPEPQPNPNCGGITPAGERFLDVLYKTVMHGDLTDASFIEQTLQTRFEVKYHDSETVKSLHYKRAVYKSDLMLAMPIALELTFDVEKDPGIQNPFIGSLRISRSKIGAFRALSLRGVDFDKKFAANFYNGMSTAHPSSMYSGFRNFDGINHSTINLVYSFDNDTDCKYISEIAVFQNKPIK